MLETYEKQLTFDNNITIEILVDFSESTRSPTGSTIPTYFTKMIYINGKKFKSYYF